MDTKRVINISPKYYYLMDHFYLDLSKEMNESLL
jgi:hypothetical protein